MSDNIIFKTFRTFKYPYLYDRHSNSITVLTEDEFHELSLVEKGELDAEVSGVVKKYQEFGMLMPNVVNKIEDTRILGIEQHLKSRIETLILQVTQQCNLRCEYCIYSGIYEHSRTHSAQRMSFETAKKAIDFFLDRNRELSDVIIGFYGGEPLLEFDLIKQCVEYALDQVEGKKIRFAMTTNGTLLTDETVDYLRKYEFDLNISLDGSKAEHDASRKFINGKGTFDTIFKNIERIHERYPDYKNSITILATINPHMNLGCVLEYFKSSEVFNDNLIQFNQMRDDNLREELNYDRDYYRIRNFEYIKALFSLIGKLDQKHVSPLVINSFQKTKRRRELLKSHLEITETMHHGGACPLGVWRLFVRVDGSLFPCERVNEALDYFKIGTLETGFDINQINKILNIGKLTENECKKCWALRLCVICAGSLNCEKEEPVKKEKLIECQRSLDQKQFELYELAVLNEFGYNADEMGAN